jgi:mannosyltransferase OCH1-like enzyme
MIPKIIHQTWKTTEIPENWKFGVDECKRIHSDYEYKLWTDDMMEDFVKKEYSDFYETYKSYKYHIQRCDAFRHLILYKYGGFYIDMDIVCKSKLDELINYDLVVTKSSSYKNVFTNSFYASSPNNPFIKYCIDNLPKHSNKYKLLGKHLHIVYSTGPNFLSNMIKEYKIENIPNYYILSPNEFAGDCSLCNPDTCKGGKFFTHVKGQTWNSWDSLLLNFCLCNYKNIIKVLLIILIIIVVIIYYYKFHNKQ